MSAQIIDFAQKKLERDYAKLQQEQQEIDMDSAALKQLQVFLRQHILDTAKEKGEMVYEQDGYTVVMDNGMAYHIPTIKEDE